MLCYCLTYSIYLYVITLRGGKFQTLKMAKHYAFPRPLYSQPLTNILPILVRQNITLFSCKKANTALKQQIRTICFNSQEALRLTVPYQSLEKFF